MGDVIGDLNRRRGQIMSMEDTPAGKTVTAEVPLAEMFQYATTVRSMSQGGQRLLWSSPSTWKCRRTLRRRSLEMIAYEQV